MTWELFALLGIFLVVVLPVWIVFHYITKWKQNTALSKEDQSLLQEIWQSTNKMESRINSLETILDEKCPDWRQKS